MQHGAGEIEDAAERRAEFGDDAGSDPTRDRIVVEAWRLIGAILGQRRPEGLQDLPRGLDDEWPPMAVDQCRELRQP